MASSSMLRVMRFIGSPAHRSTKKLRGGASRWLDRATIPLASPARRAVISQRDRTAALSVDVKAPPW